MKTFQFLAFFLLFVGLFSSCTTPSETQSQTTEAAATNLSSLVEAWNAAHNTKDAAAFFPLFADSVSFYQSTIGKEACIEKKLAMFKKHPDFTQQVASDIQTDTLNAQEVKCSFTKRVTIHQEAKEYPSYLVFKRTGATWQIITEGDAVTDANVAKKKAKNAAIPENALKGDFDGDGTPEYVWLVQPKISEKVEMDCEGACDCYLKFSNDKLASIKIENCIGGFPVNEGDLNEDGADEIGLLPDWFTSCWHAYLVYTFRENNWKYAVKPISTHCNQWENDVDAIKKDPDKSGYAIISYSEMTDTDLEVRTKSVPVAK